MSLVVNVYMLQKLTHDDYIHFQYGKNTLHDAISSFSKDKYFYTNASKDDLELPSFEDALFNLKTENQNPLRRTHAVYIATTQDQVFSETKLVYRYAQVNLDALLEILKGNEKMTITALVCFIDSFIRSVPKGAASADSSYVIMDVDALNQGYTPSLKPVLPVNPNLSSIINSNNVFFDLGEEMVNNYRELRKSREENNKKNVFSNSGLAPKPSKPFILVPAKATSNKSYSDFEEYWDTRSFLEGIAGRWGYRESIWGPDEVYFN